MKKQLRLVLFAALIMILVMMTALAASAATDGADVREEGHYYEVVSAADAATPKYYTTLAAAVGAVDADGYTITVLVNVTESGVVLDRAFTYTITGGAQGATITFNATAAAGTNKVLFNVAAGKVTLDKLTVAYDTAAITSAPAAVAYVSGACELTLNDFVTSAVVTDTVSLNAVATVTVSGTSTSISGGTNSVIKAFATKSANSAVTVSGGQFTSDKYIAHILAPITLNVTGGTLTGSSVNSMFYATAAGSSTITISNATITSGDTKGVFAGLNTKHAIALLAGTKIYANNSTMFGGFHADATMEINGAELHLVGAKALLHAASAVKVTITSTAGSVFVEDGASMPAEILDKTETQKGFDWTKLSLTVTSIADPCEITAGEHTITSLADNTALAKAGFIAANAARFPNLAVGAELDCWVPIILNGADAVLNISTVELALNTSLVEVKAGTLNITGGTYELLSEGCVIDHQGGTVNISGGTFKGADLPEAYILHSTAAEESAINITGGSFAAFGVVKAEGVVTVTITDGSFAPVDESKDSITLHVNHESAKLNVTGGTFVNMSRAVWMTAGEAAISGGKFKLGASVPCGTVVGGLATLLYVDGAVKLAVSGDADFCITVDGNTKYIALLVSANAEDAHINISGGSFGSTDNVKRTIAYCVNVAAAITDFNITGGSFYGGTSQEAIKLNAAGAVLNISGTTEIYSYRNVRIYKTATLNISGGSFNPVYNGEQVNSLLLFVRSAGAGSVINISGGDFNNYMTCFTLEGACEINVTGGTFTERTVGTSNNEAFVSIASGVSGAKFKVGTNEDGVGPVINLGRSESADGTTHCSASAFLIPANANAEIEISGGTFNTLDEENIIFNIAEGSVKKLEITGGTFFISGEEARLLPDEIFDVEGTTCVVTGATVNISYGAYLPIYKHIDASGLKLVVSGKYYVKNPFTVSRPYAGEDNGGKGYVISSISDVYRLMQNQFASFTAQGNAICASGFVPFNINGEGVVVTLEGFTDNYDMEYLIRVTKGTLNVIGGSFSAGAGESIFEVLSDNAVLNITGGFYNIKGTFSYMIRIADGVTGSGITVTNANMQVAQFGSVPLQVAFDVTAEALKINGLSELILNAAKEYTISSFADITAYVTEILSPKFPNMTVDVKTWIPLHLNNADAKLVITNGVYEASVPFMFKITAGDLEITGGKFTNDLGDIIQVVGDNVTVSINLPDNADNGMYAEDYIIWAKNASNLAVTITNGRFVEITPDTANDQNDVLFLLDGGASATVTIEGGYFEASRVLLINNVTATATINGGTFVSNQIVDGETVTARATNAHMLVPYGTGAVLVINGGSFDNKQGNFIIAPSTGASTTINGGSFNGGAGWFFTDTETTLVINANADPAKSPVFTDTEGYGDGNYYIASTHADARITINAGTFVGGVSNEYILYASKGTWNINGGIFDGSLFYVTTDSKITVGGGTYTARGAGARLFDLVGAITSSHLNITVDLATRVEEGASILETTLAKANALALLSRVTYTVNGSARLGAEIPLTKNEIWSTPEDQQHLIKEYFGDAISFEEAGTYSLILKGAFTITITGGTWEFHGGDFLKLSGVTNLVIMDGTYIVSGGDIFNLSGAATEVRIGNATDATVKPQFVVGVGGNVLQLNNAKGAFNVIIYNGSFIKGEYIGGVLTPVIDSLDYTSPLFYLEGGAKNNSKLVILNGYYEATRILMDYLSNAAIEIYNGTFKSNYVAENLRPEHYGEDGVTPIVDSLCDLFHMRGTAPFTVYGGDFDGGLGNAIFGLKGQGGGTWEFFGGTFTGGCYWIYASEYININIANTYDNDGNVIAIPVFAAPTLHTKYGIFSNTAKAGSATWNISGGSFSMKDYTGRMMLVPNGNITVKISGGEFLITRGDVYDADQQLQNDTIVFYVAGGDGYTVNIDITGGTFRAARIIAYTKVGGTLNIYGGKFISNSLSIDDSYMLHIGHDKAVFNIYGGTFTGNNYTASILVAATASGGTQTVNIFGGTFNMGDRWIYVTKPTIITIDNGSYVNENGDTVQTSPVFSGLSDGAGADMEKGKAKNYTSAGICVNAVGAVLDIKGGSFETETSHPFMLFYLVAGNVTVYPGAEMKSAYRMFAVPNAFRGNLVIKGGTFTGIGSCSIFYLETTQEKHDEKPYNSEIIIEGGTFNATESATVFYMGSAAKEYKFIIKDGTFTSAESRMLIAEGMGTQFVIEGGNFSSAAARMFFIDSTLTPLVIKNGTFTFEDRLGGGVDNAMLYVVGKAAASVEIQGGTFIDKRRGSDQSFLKMNKRGTVSFTGPFELYTLELKDNFYYDYDDNSKSFSMDNYIRAELDGEPYYRCFGYYHRYAPNMTVAPTLRPVLGSEGIVYTASVSAEVAEYLKSLGTVTYGTLIFPTEYMGSDGWQGDTDFLAELKAYALDNGRPEGTVYTIVNAVNGIVIEADGSITFRAALINLKESNYTRSISGIAFAKVTADDGTETYYYASHVSAGISGNIRKIVSNALKDVNTMPVEENGRVYCYAAIMQKNRFSRYPTVLQDYLRKYLPENQRKPKY